MPSSVREMLAEANAAVPRLNPAEVRELIGKENVLVVDVRDAPELASSGKLKGAVNVSRGMLEFRADPESPFHNPAFQKDKTVLIYCGSGCSAPFEGSESVRSRCRDHQEEFRATAMWKRSVLGAALCRRKTDASSRSTRKTHLR